MRHCHCPVVISATPAATHNCCPRLDLDSTMSRKLKIYIQNCEWHTRLSSSRDRDTQNNSAIIFGEPACVGKVELRNHNNPECWEAAGLFLPGLCDVRVGHWARAAAEREHWTLSSGSVSIPHTAALGQERRGSISTDWRDFEMLTVDPRAVSSSCCVLTVNNPEIRRLLLQKTRRAAPWLSVSPWLLPWSCHTECIIVINVK